jgi:hypothetical protein
MKMNLLIWMELPKLECRSALKEHFLFSFGGSLLFACYDR